MAHNYRQLIEDWKKSIRDKIDMKATEHIASKQAPPAKPSPKEERPPTNVGAIAKQVDILEEQSLTKRQEDAVAEIRSILGIAPDSPEVDNTLPVPEPEPEPPAKHHGK
jgi:hypothetical protein